MFRNTIALIFLAASGGLCQTAGKEPDALQALLVEVRQLRQDVEAISVGLQRVQIALSALQMQDAAVNRGTQRLDTIRNRCSGAEQGKRFAEAELQRLETALSSGTLPPAEANGANGRISQLKGNIETQAATLQTCRAEESEASNQLRNDQAALSDVRSRIERLDQALAEAARR